MIVDENGALRPTPLGVDANCRPYGNIIGSEDSSYHTPKVTLQWFMNDDAMTYFLMGQGSQAGGHQCAVVGRCGGDDR